MDLILKKKLLKRREERVRCRAGWILRLNLNYWQPYKATYFDHNNIEKNWQVWEGYKLPFVEGTKFDKDLHELNHLKDWDCDSDEQEKALEALQDRYLVEEVVESDKLLLRQHNLIRSVALEHSRQLDEEDE